MILANRSQRALNPVSYLGLALALHMECKDAESRAACNQLFAFWENADLPVLLQAKAAYAKLQPPTSSPPGG